jgi:CHAT domain-containing protein/tetratricopeptide (TPR) repeat protein
MTLQIPELPALSSNLFDLLKAIWKTLQVKLSHEKAMSSTGRGRRSSDLRTAAQNALHHLPVEKTHEMFRQAAELHPPEDLGRAAAAARFDLARSFERQQTGSRMENYLHAEQMYRQVLLCPERDEDPLRAALTRDALAVSLRKIAKFPGQMEFRPELMSEAVRYSLESIRLALGAGPLGLMQAASYLNSLANHLRNQTGQFDEAMVCLQRAEECIQQALSVETKLVAALNGPARQMLSPGDLQTIGCFLSILKQERDNDSVHGVLYNISGAYLERGRPDDRKAAEKLLLRIIKGQSVTKTVPAQGLLAELYLDQNKKAEAINLLRQISVEQVGPDEAENMVHVFERAGLLDESLNIAHHYISKFHRMRMESRADHIADVLASRAHDLGAMAARIYAKKGNPVAAFLALETTSGAHFEEQIGQFVRPQTAHPIARGLLEIGSVFKAASIGADEMASRFEQIRAKDPGEARAGLQQLLEMQKSTTQYEYAHYRNEVAERYTRQTFVNLFEKALAAADPVASLREDSVALLDRLIQFGNKARSLDPRLAGLFYFPLLDTRELAALLKRYPDTCFIRLSQESDLLVVSVWHEKGRICSATHRVTLARRLFSLLDEIRDDPKAGSPALLRQELERIDLSAAFPPTKRAVLLPSWAASLLPLAALGPRGKTLLDRYSSLLWLPSLASLRARQAPSPPRQGTLTIAPHCTSPLMLNSWALRIALPNERRLFDMAATRSRVKEDARTADTVAFYTHGRHEPGHIEIELSDQDDPLRAEDAWCFRGAERVELWACQTGVNLATDWLDQHGHDQHFGLDVAMLESGARSAIGSLWAVPELVTACIVRRYRAALRSGEDAATALCTAQRAFRDEILPQILSVFDRGDATIWESVDRYFAKLSIPEESATPGLSDRSLTPNERARLRECLSSPTAWAGFRFVGVPDLRPTEPWDPETIRPLTAYELMDVDELAKELLGSPTPAQTDPDEDQSGDDGDEDDDAPFWLEQEALLREAWASEDPFSPEHALRTARLYHDRQHGSRTHNLLFGLAWLYEVLTQPSLSAADRALVRLEAAHFWLEMAESELLSELAVVFSPPAAIPLARANELLKDDPPNVLGSLGNRAGSYQLSRSAAQARLRFLSVLQDHKLARNVLNLEDTINRAVSVARPFFDSLLMQRVEPDYAIQRALSIACGILLQDPKSHQKALAQLAKQASKALPKTSEPVDWASTQRLSAWQRLVLAELEPERQAGIKKHWDLPPRERLRIAQVEMLELKQHGPIAGDRMKDVLSAHLSSLEQAFWGWPSARLRPLLRSTGNPGEGYRSLFGAFLLSPKDAPAVHHIACMQQACDMRIPLLHRLIHAAPLAAGVLGVDLLALWQLVLYRERLIQAWADTVSGPFGSTPARLAVDSADVTSGKLADPFTQDGASLEKASAAAKDLSAWVLSSLAKSPRHPGATQGQTVAFQAVAQIAALSETIEKRWQDALRRSDNRAKDVPSEIRGQADIAVLLDPGVEIKGCERWIRELPEGTAVLGLMFSSPMSVAGSFTWRTRSTHGEQSAALEPTLEVRGLLAAMFQEINDAEERRGVAGQRAERWARLTDVLAPFLRQLMGPALDTKEPLHLYVLAPGSLRALPIAGLRAGDKPLLTAFRSVTHLPALKFADPLLPVKQARKTACLFAASAPDAGMLEFGRATIKTLRAAFPVHAIEPRGPDDLNGSDIVENDVIRALASDLACLRIYGQGSVISGTATDAHLHLSHERILSSRNIMEPLPACDVVELWAATAGLAPCFYATSDREDRLPGLVPSFIQCGASGVIDLAWPVFDLVKALVCERYGLVRWRLSFSPAEALTQAVSWTHRLIDDWAQARAEHVGIRSALIWLDQSRRAGLIALGGDPAWVEPYAPQSEHPLLHELSVDELITEARHPSHFAAFRYWGGIHRSSEHDAEESAEQ